MAGNARSGRRPQSAALKLLRGNPSKTAINKWEPHHPPLELDPPDWFTDAEAIAEWQRLAPMLSRAGHCSIGDRALFIVYCLAWSEWKRCAVEAQSAPLMNEEGTARNPIHVHAERLSKRLLSALGDLGLTPTSRTRVIAKPAGATVSKWAGAIP